MDIFYLLPLRLRPLAQGHRAYELMMQLGYIPTSVQDNDSP